MVIINSRNYRKVTEEHYKMRKNIKVAAVLFTLFVAVMYAGEAYGQRPVLGGNSKKPVDSPEVKRAAAFAIEAQAEKTEVSFELLEILTAESQVVAGTKYTMCLKVSSAGEGEEAAEYFVMAVVAQDLKKNYKLISWSDSDCGGVTDEGEGDGDQY